MKKSKSSLKRNAFLILVLLIFGVTYIGHKANEPMQPGAKSHYYRVHRKTSLNSILTELQAKHVLRSAKWASLFARLHRDTQFVRPGTYLIGPGESGAEIASHFREPVVLKFRIPSTNWAQRTAKLLQEHEVCLASRYMSDVHDPALFQKYVKFPLPKTSLEGYLYPDTYDVEPLSSAHRIIRMQLLAFQRKVYDRLNHPKNLALYVTIGSLIELEVARNVEKPLVSAVIYNRLKRNMRLQIDASVNYALGEWRPLKYSDLKKAPGPYNLYRHNGLPPGPICSPTYSSIEAAMHPARVNYLYYVALPNGHTLFSSTFSEQKQNIQRRKRALENLSHNQSRTEGLKT